MTSAPRRGVGPGQSLLGRRARLGVAAAGAATAVTGLVRGLAGTLAVFVLAATTPMVDIIGGLRRARVPDPLIDVAGVTYRLLFVLLDSTRTILEAQAARLGYADRRLALRSAASLLVAILNRSWSSAQHTPSEVLSDASLVTEAHLRPPWVLDLWSRLASDRRFAPRMSASPPRNVTDLAALAERPDATGRSSSPLG